MPRPASLAAWSRPLLLVLTAVLLALSALASPVGAADRALDVQAHRGGRGIAPENSLAAFHNCIELRVPTIELDVQVTPAGALHVAHDPDFDPATAPRLAEVLDLVEDATYPVRLSLEIKRQRPLPGFGPAVIARLVVGALDAYDLGRRTIIQSFDQDVLLAVKEVAPDIELSVLVRNPEDYESALERTGAAILSPRVDGLERAHVERAHLRGARVIPWVVNDPAEAAKLVSWGVDGFITDRPDLLMADLGVKAEVENVESLEDSSEAAAAATRPPLSLRDVRTVAVYPFTSGGNVDTFCTSIFIQEAERRRAIGWIVDPYQLSVTAADGRPFRPQEQLPRLIEEARSKGADALLLGEGKWYNWGFRMEWRLIETNQGAVVWHCAYASGFTFSGPSAKRELQRKAVSNLLRSRR